MITTVLFDLDGTLIDTETLVNGVASQVVSKYGKSLPHSVQQAALGKRPLEAWKIVADQLEIPKTAEELFEESEPLLVDRWQHCKTLPGAVRLVDHLFNSGVKLGIVTSSLASTFERKLCLKKALASKFGAVITGDCVEAGKPSPEGLLAAAKQLGSEPEECLVIEDAPVGFKAAVAAGMRVVAVPSLAGLPQESLEGCTKVLASLLDFHPDEFGLPPFGDVVHGVVPLQPVWKIKGPVVRGFGRGSATLGIPTANLPPESLMNELSGAVSGIYCGFASVGSSAEVHKMVMSIGWNPFFNNKDRTAEPWILHEFAEPFYGEELRLVVCGYIRPEANFTTLEALIARIHEDARITREALSVPELDELSKSEFLKPVDN
uniref:riboflavin kinase n=1 Tax=Tetraselmis sp. GSL018 TaxID=582737 RepID=A0A061QWQ1_9CHLO|eukprot:CAMPEP_0177613538 /NCGR_PEP_ID=MMETSP0419_2-20121207/22053_1 /TAXON_ID=582737 /ORGANISM="Tetraselmis sp., Strain GSL018" /LENGTH=376 /DNA_ID=CAMNT_0019110291 /DNA_START=56 /DNA_END=1186 /DNA_ORIENTATION=+